MFRQRIWNLVYTNALYAKGRQGFLEGAIDWDTDDIRVALVDLGASTYIANITTNLATHDNMDDITGYSGVTVVARSAALASKTVTDGVADAADITFTAVSGASCECIIIYKYNASDSAARLIAFIDTATGLPITPNGGDITIQWSSGADKIFKL